MQTSDQAAVRKPLVVLLLVALFFFACSLPLLPLLSRYRGDEGFYTNAAIRMVETRDYLTPYYADGQARFNKPPLNYWLIAGSYHVFGINYFAARFAQLIAGALALLATYRLAHVLFEDPRVALAAAAVMLTNEEALNSSIRATTDVVQYFFLAVSMAGLAAIMLRGSRSKADYLLAYGGLGMAIMTKGGVALLMLAFAIVFAAIHARVAKVPVGARLRRLLPPLGLLWMILPLGVWFALNVRTYGMSAINGFWNDQVGSRLEGSGEGLLENVLAYTTAPIVSFLPWTIGLGLVAWSGRDQIRAVIARRRVELVLILSFLATLYVILLFGNITRTRYLLPAYPLVAGGIAYLLIAISDSSRAAEGAGRALSGVGAISAIVFSVVLGIFTLRLPAFTPSYGAMPPVVFAILLLAAAVAALIFFLRRRVTAWARIVTTALLLLAAYRVTDLSARSHLFMKRSAAIAAAVQAEMPAGTTLAAAGLSTESDQIRVLSGGKVAVQLFGPSAKAEQLREFSAVLLDGASTLNLGAEYREVEIPPGAELWKPAELFRLLWGSKSLAELRRDRPIKYRLLVRDTAAK